MFLYELPESVCRYIVLIYLDSVSLVRLDTAMSCSRTRPHFLSSIHGDYDDIYNSLEYNINDEDKFTQFTCWIGKRGMSLCSYMMLPSNIMLLSISQPKLRYLQLASRLTNNIDIDLIPRLFPRLEILILGSLCTIDTPNVSLTDISPLCRCKSLRILHLGMLSSQVLLTKSIMWCLMRCLKLEEIHLHKTLACSLQVECLPPPGWILDTTLCYQFILMKIASVQ
jgi:hypothetical protein